VSATLKYLRQPGCLGSAIVYYLLLVAGYLC